MTVWEVHKYGQMLANRLPGIGKWLRRRAVQGLISLGTPDVLQVLCEGAKRSDHRDCRDASLKALVELYTSGLKEAGEALCDLAIDEGLTAARRLADLESIVPGRVERRALFHFAAEDWRALREIDPGLDRTARGWLSAAARTRFRLGMREMQEFATVGGTQTHDVNTFAVTRDGGTLVTGSGEKQEVIGIYELPSGRMLERLKPYHKRYYRPTGPSEEVPILPPALPNLTRSLEDMQKSVGAFTCIAIHPLGHVFATGSRSGGIRLWDLVNRSEIDSLAGHQGSVSGLAFHPEEELLVSVGLDGVLKTWNTSSYEQVGVCRHATGPIHCLRIEPSSHAFLTAGRDGRVVVWDVETGKPLVRFQPHMHAINAMAIHPVRRQVITASLDGSMRISDWTRGEEVGRLDFEGAVLTVAVSKSGRYAAAGSSDGACKIYDLESNEPVAGCQLHSGGVHQVLISPSDRFVTTLSSSPDTRIWSCPGLEQVAVLEGHRRELIHAGFCGDCDVLLTAGQDGQMRQWPLHILPLARVTDFRASDADNRWLDRQAARTDLKKRQQTFVALLKKLNET